MILLNLLWLMLMFNTLLPMRGIFWEMLSYKDIFSLKVCVHKSQTNVIPLDQNDSEVITIIRQSG